MKAGNDGQSLVQNGESASGRSMIYGLVLFLIYLALYAGYVFITAFAPEVMERVPLGGINLSVLYGLGLIGVAILMAIAYDWLCRCTEKKREQDARDEKGRS